MALRLSYEPHNFTLHTSQKPGPRPRKKKPNTQLAWLLQLSKTPPNSENIATLFRFLLFHIVRVGCLGLRIIQNLQLLCLYAAGVPNLALVEGVDNEKIANHLDRAVSNLGRNPLKVLVQVNTSGEISKSGIDPSDCVELAKHVKFQCPNLEFSGLMTIGMPDYTSTPENFRMLSKCRAQVCKALDMAEEHCELSMGMSGDFEQAIEMGSTNVRIGSTIFGPRDYAKKQPD
ncbi:pyridoxal phosphate homeostasis protein-like [Prunus avium]|uniref:Pyridoxal phosphate homeostasis protein-like n=1 Tax=Prunus avium TaxID=42229 RepID=A0A6P5S165_PRUAV|nr:pyridoxal phosphate homeostasis protein-like [Prunus avium]